MAFLRYANASYWVYFEWAQHVISQRKRPLVFISHVSEDKRLIRPYLDRLISDGIDLYIDRPEEIWNAVPDRIKGIYCGSDWNDEIEAAVRKADRIIAFWYI